MLRINVAKPCKIVYSLYKHEYLGYLFEPHIVQLTNSGTFSLTHQRIHLKTAKEFDAFLDETDHKLIKILEECDQDFIIKKITKTNQRPTDFFKTYDEKIHALVRPNIERRISEAIQLMSNKEVFVMSKEGDPAWKKIQIAQEPASVLFHFRRGEESTRYFPTLKFQEKRIEFMFKDAHVISNLPAWMLLDDQLLFFEKDFEGKKLIPFLNKRFIDIPKASELSYFKKFVTPLIEKYHVYAEGFEIITQKFEAVPQLKVAHTWNEGIELILSFRYGDYLFPYKSGNKVSVTLEEKNGSYIFHRVKRSHDWERSKIKVLTDLGLKPSEGSAFIPGKDSEENTEEGQIYHVFDWLNNTIEQLREQGFEVIQGLEGKKYFIGKNKLELKITENNDWFDIHAIIQFGEFEISFIELKNYILSGKKEFTLPNGEIAVIPQQWFAQYHQLFSFAEGSKNIRLQKHHIGLIKAYSDGNLAEVSMNNKLNRLVSFDEIEETPLPEGFQGELRPYQKAGYDWFYFLRKFNFGGCLADDMGLGKTIQTLALLQKVKEDHEKSTAAVQKLGQGNLFDVTFSTARLTSLIIMPTSLIHNWIKEAQKFAPDLKILTYTGIDRNRDIRHFAEYDIVLTTYGIARIDQGELQKFYFHYIILDESQAIKNPSSKIARAVKVLKGKHRLALTGTPIENSVVDLWSQMAFINPGLLGTQSFFFDEYAVPIEKRKDELKAIKLQALIKPFVLRRTKKQVASELPEKIEHLYYSTMTAEQEQVYEETKSYYRNEILKLMSDNGKAGIQMPLLQGLTKLRQIANHPILVDENYEGGSGKFSDVFFTLENTIAKGHRILVFSQFVKHLNVLRKLLDEKEIAYSYLDGSTQNREEAIQKFREDDTCQIFLISIKAGGVGLNLTEADYVFILDPWWNPAVEQQAIDRTHRIGQTKNVFIYKFITKNSVEEKIIALQERKKVMADTLIRVEDSFMKSLSEEDIKAILE